MHGARKEEEREDTVDAHRKSRDFRAGKIVSRNFIFFIFVKCVNFQALKSLNKRGIRELALFEEMTYHKPWIEDILEKVVGFFLQFLKTNLIFSGKENREE